MELVKNQLEKVRYQLSKVSKSATNEEIRKAAESFDEFDAQLIADYIIHSSQLVTSLNGLTIINNETPKTSNSLTIPQKQSLIKVQATQMGIELSDSEVLQIIDSQDSEESDSIKYLLSIQDLIRDFISHKNAELTRTTQRIISDIGNVINDGNLEKARIINNANAALRDIVDQCKQQATDYKSPYASRLESIREALELRKTKALS